MPGSKILVMEFIYIYPGVVFSSTWCLIEINKPSIVVSVS